VFPVRLVSPEIFSVRRLVILRAFVFLFAAMAVSARAGTQTIWLGWDDAPPEENIVQYQVFYGTQPGVYTNSDTVYYSDGDYIYGLEEGNTYYFAVAAMDADGQQSRLSAETSYTVPLPPRVPLTSEIYYDGSGMPYGMSIMAAWASPFDWELDYSTDLQNWSPWAAGHGTDCWSYVNFSWGDQFFFRLVLF
jgi:hypothetical protein